MEINYYAQNESGDVPRHFVSVEDKTGKITSIGSSSKKELKKKLANFLWNNYPGVAIHKVLARI